ncbi:hypothetical protein HPB48_026353 [Haemaphysalis longicornis]|uniref:CCHC-type domain-containing protein n=1 Tax=Haemaphysalis longicornis TaxID=44386 RepID=A0A9J6HBN0_HAELO|nr:hypothetical protein HPB48_026353 [Haemaphysalis longicornis]
MIIGDRNIQFEVKFCVPKGTSRGVIHVDPGDSNADLRSYTTCESANIPDIRRLGKRNCALVTFDTLIPPKTVRNFTKLCPVKPYVPRTLVCYHCHRDGHLQKHCPNAAVCFRCGKTRKRCPTAISAKRMVTLRLRANVEPKAPKYCAGEKIGTFGLPRGVGMNSQPHVFQRSRLPRTANMATFQLHRHDDKTMKGSGTARLLQHLPSESLSHCNKPTYSAVLQDSSAEKFQTTEEKATTLWLQ